MNKTNLSVYTPKVYTLGHDELLLQLDGMTDMQVLEEAATQLPNGVNLQAPHTDAVWVHPGHLLGLAHDDGLELSGICGTACELLRCASDVERAKKIGGSGLIRLIKMFQGVARDRAQAKRPNQIHAYRFGVGCKVVASDLCEPDQLIINPKSKLALELAKGLGVDSENLGALNNKKVLLFRTPFILGGVFTLVPNVHASTKTVMVNRLTFRKVTLGDTDGDNISLYPISDDDLAVEIGLELEASVPGGDPTLRVLGKASHSREADMWGENIFADGKTTEKKLTFTKTLSQTEWINSHALMGDYANKLTPFAYRISDIGSLMSACGVPGARDCGLMGAVIEETFYLGLTGGPPELDEALETWFRSPMDRANINICLDGLLKVVTRSVMTTEVKAAIINAAKTNRLKYGVDDLVPNLVHGMWMMGKGRTSGLGLANLVNLVQFAGDERVPVDIRDNFLVRLLFRSARQLSQTVRDVNPDGSDSDSDDYQGADNYQDHEDVAHLAY